MGGYLLRRKTVKRRGIYFIIISIFTSIFVSALFASSEKGLPGENPQIDTRTETVRPPQTAPQPEKKAAYIPLDMPYSEHKLIDKYRTEFMSDFGRKWLTGVMQNAAVYRPYIRRTLAEYGLPQCLEFLPVIESSYNVYAVSKSGATGLWQFMENSIAGLLEKNEWLDERKDPWLSTNAAVKKLNQLVDSL